MVWMVRPWRALAIHYGVHGHPLPYAHAVFKSQGANKPESQSPEKTPNPDVEPNFDLDLPSSQQEANEPESQPPEKTPNRDVEPDLDLILPSSQQMEWTHAMDIRLLQQCQLELQANSMIRGTVNG
jgi:hypothetical protein